MYEEDIIEPISCPEAFREGGETAMYSQGAFLLLLGIILNAEHRELLKELKDPRPFEFPLLEPIPKQVDSDRFWRLLAESKKFAKEDKSTLDSLRFEKAKSLYQSQGVNVAIENAVSLLALSLMHPNELIRVTAAVSTLDLVCNPTVAFITLIESVMKSRSELIRSIAITSLSRSKKGSLYLKLYKSYKSLNIFFRRSPRKNWKFRRKGGFDSTIVHGTLFSSVGHPIDEWWAPVSGEFHDYIKNGSRPNVYSGEDYFYWSGGWSDHAREDAAKKFVCWAKRHNASDFDVLAHSHGCNVTMLASNNLRLGKLVLMSCPVHWGTYQPDFNNVSKVILIRIKWDFVIMADRGGQRFHDSRIHEHVLPLWFGRHESSRKSNTWRNRQLDTLI
jgi:hypothetical protein